MLLLLTACCDRAHPDLSYVQKALAAAGLAPVEQRSSLEAATQKPFPHHRRPCAGGMVILVRMHQPPRNHRSTGTRPAVTQDGRGDPP